VEVEAVVPHLLELVQDPVRRIGAQLADLVVDLLDVRLAAGVAIPSALSPRIFSKRSGLISSGRTTRER